MLDIFIRNLCLILSDIGRALSIRSYKRKNEKQEQSIVKKVMYNEPMKQVNIVLYM